MRSPDLVGHRQAIAPLLAGVSHFSPESAWEVEIESIWKILAEAADTGHSN